MIVFGQKDTNEQEEEMLILIFLFGLAWLVASRMAQKDYYGAKVLFVLTMGIFFGFCLIWQDRHDWPGVTEPAFVDQMITWAVAVVLGFLPESIFGARLTTRS